MPALPLSSDSILTIAQQGQGRIKAGLEMNVAFLLFRPTSRVTTAVNTVDWALPALPMVRCCDSRTILRFGVETSARDLA